ncbi:MAG: hypothetical protein QG670_426 [Thermoproteota archaeon]|nr:hypothetical protein [Thermoproteota archaeon]
MSESLSQLYMLNLIVTVAMCFVLIFRAWVEHRNYRIMWREVEWRKSCEVAERILKAEKESFRKMEGGEELYRVLSELFQKVEG